MAEPKARRLAPGYAELNGTWARIWEAIRGMRVLKETPEHHDLAGEMVGGQHVRRQSITESEIYVAETAEPCSAVLEPFVPLQAVGLAIRP